MSRRDKTPLEQGAAELRVTLRNGQVTVLHASGGTLLKGPLPAGGWRKIVDGILAAAPMAEGEMRD